MKEFPTIEKKYRKGMKKLAIVYPNKYYGGIYNLGILIIYNLVNKRNDWICERRFLENANDLNKFDLVGFTWQYESDIKLINKIIKNNKIKSLTFAGGPCINNNFKPLKGLIDFFVIGETEDILDKILDNYNNINKLKNIKGVHIPNKNKPTYTNPPDINKFYPLIQPMPLRESKEFVFGKSFLLEVERGCVFNCKFCPKHFKPRYRDINKIKEIIDQGLKLNKRNKVVIYTPSFTHPKKKEILKYLIKNKIKFTIPSIRVETADKEFLDLVYLGGQRSLTIAPECGETLRPTLGKFAKDKDFFEFAEQTDKFKEIKLYFMIGIPNQNKKDLEEVIQFINKFKKIFKGRLYISINPFVPKPNTYLEKHKFSKKQIKEQVNYLKKNIKLRLKIGSISTAYKNWKIAHSDSSAAALGVKP